MNASVAIHPDALEQAAGWLMLLHAGSATEADRHACRRWQEASPDNARAWERAERLMNKLGGLPPELAMPALDRPARADRRSAIVKLVALLAMAPAGWLAWRTADRQGWNAGHHTVTGERRTINLADGSEITLNTATAIDIAFDARERVVRLRHGEILIRTGHDASTARPFYVETAEGRMEALGTRFNVRQDDGRTQLAVFESAVRIEPRKLARAQFRIIQAGQKTAFTASDIDAVSAGGRADEAWTQGMLLADRMALRTFTAELARYRSGIVHCDPAIGGLPVSGTFPLDDPERVLTMLVSTYPVDAVRRFSGYWISLTPRS